MESAEDGGAPDNAISGNVMAVGALRWRRMEWFWYGIVTALNPERAQVIAIQKKRRGR